MKTVCTLVVALAVPAFAAAETETRARTVTTVERTVGPAAADAEIVRDDATIAERIRNRLELTFGDDAKDVEVDVEDGIVYLRAPRLVPRIGQVRECRVRRALSCSRTDPRIRAQPDDRHRCGAGEREQPDKKGSRTHATQATIHLAAQPAAAASWRTLRRAPIAASSTSDGRMRLPPASNACHIASFRRGAAVAPSTSAWRRR